MIKGTRLEDFIVFVHKTKGEAQNWVTYPTSFPPDSKCFYFLANILLDLQLSLTHSSFCLFPETQFNWVMTVTLPLTLLLLLRVYKEPLPSVLFLWQPVGATPC